MEKGSSLSVLDKILSNYAECYDAEKKVADFVLDHPAQVIDMTVAELAGQCGVSEATIIRFCKRCGCKGFHRLKLDLARETAVSNLPDPAANELRADDLGASVQKILQNKQEELQETLQGIDTETCRAVLDLLQQARMVVFAAVGNTIPIALDSVYKFNELGITAITSTIWEHLSVTVRTLTPQDVVVVLSASGESKHVLDIAHYAVERDIPVVAITNHTDSTLAKMSRHVLRTVSREKLFFRNHSVLSTRLSMMAVVEMLYFLLCSRKTDSFHYIDAHEESIADEKI
ncbi:MurR/RpiR family transcriptional regulator [Mitsuokella sp.]|uniref:MurR/RpiR family transcriptional regulator n=1 Tax=Mitsuokella sp. TaxID=2049034 RepID=UPI0029E5EB09|nr:MurR/RpiR family transcriptional regulator [Mitsuokella sp.]MDD6383379.1 MurR/RpiR family transcriptional regulator [Selenomonadaceae bacterium]MDY4475354.1 MurR/RpiR family transcriptional regulator [Mitsuokella sp.]